MILRSLTRRWFNKGKTSQIKNWISARDSTHFCLSDSNSLFGKGLLVTESHTEGYSGAGLVYEYYNQPVNMIYVNRVDKDTIWFVLALNNILLSDYELNLNNSDSSFERDIQIKLIQELERFSNLSTEDEVTIITMDYVVDDSAHVAFFESVRFPAPFRYLVKDDHLPTLEELSQSMDIETYSLVSTGDLKYPLNKRLVQSVAGGVLALMIYSFWPAMESNEPVTVKPIDLPPVIVDTFKDLKVLVSETGIGIKQRFVYIVKDLEAVRALEGWDIISYVATGNGSLITLVRKFGTINQVKRLFTTPRYNISQTPEGVTISSRVQTFPILRKPVRANSSAEISWLNDAVKYVWPQVVISSGVAVKPDSKQSFIESKTNLTFDDFYIEDIDSLSSLFVGRSMGFLNFHLKPVNETQALAGTFEFTVIGVPHEYYGLDKK